MEHSVNQRVASIIMKMDPFEPFFQKFGGVFSKNVVKPGDNLNEQSKILLEMWANKTHTDPSFIYLCDWLRDKQGQDMVQKGNPTAENILYSRALFSIVVSLQDEIRRLSGLYDERLKGKDEDFDTIITVE